MVSQQQRSPFFLNHCLAGWARVHACSSRFALYRQDHWISYNEHELVGDMPSALRADVVTFVQRKTIEQIPWLERRGKTFVADVVVQLKPCIFTVSSACFCLFSPTMNEACFVDCGHYIPCHVLPCHAILCRTVPYHMPCHATPSMSCHTIPYRPTIRRELKE